MMTPLNEPLPATLHVSAAEYRAFLERHYASEDMWRYYELRRAQFVQTYPDMSRWFDASLEERVGRRITNAADSPSRISYRGRQYLFYLAMRHHIPFDWEWLISLSNIHLDSFLIELGFRQDLDQLQQEALRLGYHPVTVTRYLHWTASRIFLHTGFLPISRWTEAHCQDMMEAVRRYCVLSDNQN